ncbi:MAG: hypothetical protein AAGA95_20415 [Pseudomonadota bacterium]
MSRQPSFTLRDLFATFVLLAVLSTGFHFFIHLRHLQAAHRRLRSTMLELQYLDLALRAFAIEHGAAPPIALSEDLTDLIRTASPEQLRGLCDDDLDLLLGLDEQEQLVYWLGDPARSSLPISGIGHFFEFDTARFVDADRDGFPEYQSLSGSPFALCGERAALCARN